MFPVITIQSVFCPEPDVTQLILSDAVNINITQPLVNRYSLYINREGLSSDIPGYYKKKREYEPYFPTQNIVFF